MKLIHVSDHINIHKTESISFLDHVISTTPSDHTHIVVKLVHDDHTQYLNLARDDTSPHKSLSHLITTQPIPSIAHLITYNTCYILSHSDPNPLNQPFIHTQSSVHLCEVMFQSDNTLHTCIYERINNIISVTTLVKMYKLREWHIISKMLPNIASLINISRLGLHDDDLELLSDSHRKNPIRAGVLVESAIVDRCYNRRSKSSLLDRIATNVCSELGIDSASTVLNNTSLTTDLLPYFLTDLGIKRIVGKYDLLVTNTRRLVEIKVSRAQSNNASHILQLMLYVYLYNIIHPNEPLKDAVLINILNNTKTTINLSTFNIQSSHRPTLHIN